ncbi:MAG TPA: MBL fold metallo-hydrolase [Dehalococcoidales bacterium]|jgi:L-ascorbate metabolism protein UlaG (beta-lactamase superfamily)|nr:MBL fold metallo-hydrolase [Dehalococcoidales bacterium]
MEITWLGHSCFKLKGKQATVITDPFSPATGYTLGKVTADIVTVSHPHPGHSYVQGVADEPRVLKSPGEYESAGVLTVGVHTYHDNEKGAQRGKNTAFVIDVDDVMICHLGDLGHVLTAEQVAEIDGVDVLLIPVGGVSTIDAVQAAQIVRQLEPKIVIPMHYKTEAEKKDLETADRFLKEMGVKEAIAQPKLLVNKSSLPLTMQVVMLSYK